MAQKCILFDLDGTLTDSGEGIINCATVALEHFHLPVPDRETMRVFVGPPLRDTFQKFGVPEDRVDEAISIYRQRYIPIGKFENQPYPGVYDLLERLNQDGHRLFVATSKPEQMSMDILDHFDLTRYFERVCGATLDGSRDEKSAVIAYLLECVNDTANTIMVGDTVFDTLGAAAHGIPMIGVSWGFGEVEAMQNAGAKAIAHTMDELYNLLTQE